MKLRMLAVATAAALALAGCGGAGDLTEDNSPSASPSAAQPTAVEPSAGESTSEPTRGPRGSGDADCSVFSKDELIAFVMFTQFIGQVRTVSSLEMLSQMGYTPDAYAGMLDDLDQLKGVEGEVYGTPDQALANFRKANDIFGEILAKGEAASDADFAPVAALWASNDEWIKDQAAITGALNVVCPDLA